MARVRPRHIPLPSRHFAALSGGDGYDDLLPYSISLRLDGVECLCLGSERLIYVKRAAGRPKDLEVLAELEIISNEQSGSS